MYNEIILDNNLTIVYNQISHLKSVSLGVWIGSGSRHETVENNGVSHFIEHMLFKGTKTRTAKDIASEIDNIGGQINAFTSKDCTCFYTSTLDTDIEIAVDVLSDMLFNSVFDIEHMGKEKMVVLEEISMYEDDPEELVNDLLTEGVWSDGPLGYPILGTRKSVVNITRETIYEYMSAHYIPDNCVISVVGNVEKDKLVSLLQKKFGSWKPLNYCRFYPDQPRFKSHYIYKEKGTEQTHLCLGFRGFPMNDKRNYNLMILNNIIGGSISSILFQKIREESGLAYSIYSFPSSFRDCGMFTIYAATNPASSQKVISQICNEIEKLLKNGISKSEFVRSKNQLKGNYILGLDSTTAHMVAIGKSKVITGVVKSAADILNEIESITLDQIMETAQWVFDGKHMGIAVLGGVPLSECCLDNYIY
ncbi:MAG: insulinase family protein [Clostridiaceae bacterium]|nr:insulinase family protein [Clostridiaceae bacterium]